MNSSVVDTAYGIAARGFIEAAVLYERATTGVAFNPLANLLEGDPYPVYAELRARDPVHRSRVFNGWILSRYAEVCDVLKDPSFTADRLQVKRRFFDIRRRPRRNYFFRTVSKTMLTLDGDEHDRLRAVVADWFTPRATASLRGMIADAVHAQLDRLPASGEVDLMVAFAEPVGETIIARILGLPVEERALLRPLTRAIQAGVAPSVGAGPLTQADQATAAFRHYVRRLIELRGPEPRDDVFSGLLAAVGGRINMDELHAMLVLLTLAGHDPLIALVGSGVSLLLQHPAAREQLLGDPSLAPLAAQEIARYDTPVQITSRVASEDCEVGGALVTAGQKVLLLLGSANRDPAQFHDPDTLNISRHPNSHLAYGRAQHYCLGAPLSAVTAEIALLALFERYPRLTLGAEPPRYARSFNFRRMERLPVNLG